MTRTPPKKQAKKAAKVKLVTKTVEVLVLVDVTVDENKFTPEFMTEFATLIADYDMRDHFEHLAWLHVCREMDETCFIEGYGIAKDMGIAFKERSTATEVLSK